MHHRTASHLAMFIAVDTALRTGYRGVVWRERWTDMRLAMRCRETVVVGWTRTHCTHCTHCHETERLYSYTERRSFSGRTLRPQSKPTRKEAPVPSMQPTTSTPTPTPEPQRSHPSPMARRPSPARAPGPSLPHSHHHPVFSFQIYPSTSTRTQTRPIQSSLPQFSRRFDASRLAPRASASVFPLCLFSTAILLHAADTTGTLPLPEPMSMALAFTLASI
jgi:hypothetical protein